MLDWLQDYIYDGETNGQQLSSLTNKIYKVFLTLLCIGAVIASIVVIADGQVIGGLFFLLVLGIAWFIIFILATQNKMMIDVLANISDTLESIDNTQKQILQDVSECHKEEDK